MSPRVKKTVYQVENTDFAVKKKFWVHQPVLRQISPYLLNDLQICFFLYYVGKFIVCIQLYGFKYSYLLLTIYTQLYDFK